VLIHGIGSFFQVWEPVLPALEAEREVIAIDLPGFGASAVLDGGREPHPVALAAAVAAFLDELGLADAHIAATRSAAGSRSSWPSSAARGRSARCRPRASGTGGSGRTRRSRCERPRVGGAAQRRPARAHLRQPPAAGARAGPVRGAPGADAGRRGHRRGAQPGDEPRLGRHARGDGRVARHRRGRRAPAGDDRVGREGPAAAAAPGRARPPRAAVGPSRDAVRLRPRPTWDDPALVARTILTSG
jgi:hypothetical protein